METALHLAALKGHSGVVKFLLGTGADINAVDSEGLIALHWAAYYGHREVVKSLFGAGADIKAVDFVGWLYTRRPRVDMAGWTGPYWVRERIPRQQILRGGWRYTGGPEWT